MAEPSASSYPAALDDNTTLFGDAVNLKQLSLDAQLAAGATTASVAESIVAINTPCYLLIGSELIYAEGKSGGDFTPCVRGAGGTSDVIHTAGTAVYVVYAANYHNQVKRALIAIETEIGAAPKTIDDTVSAGASPASVAEYLDMVANRLKSISGESAWHIAGNRFLSLTVAGNLDFPTSSELTISSGAVTPTKNWHTIDTQADAASDDLDTLTTTNATDGFILILRANNDARTVVIKHNTGNIYCERGDDILLDDTRDIAFLIYDATLSKWLAMSNTFDIRPPAGIIMNGKLSITVSSNNLVIALVGKDGNALSNTNPAYVYIGEGWRKINTALSVTVNAGTSTFNAGSAELATKELDLFAYLRYNATDGVCLGASRIPFGRIYSDFSTTATNEKYAAWNTTATAAASDECCLIGRFAATLSAGAGYTWTVPTFTAANLIQRPIFNTRILSYAPTLTGYSSAPTSAIYEYQINYNFCHVKIREAGDGTSNATTLIMSAPFTHRTVANDQTGVTCQGKDNGSVLAAPAWAVIASAANTIGFYKDLALTVWTGSGAKRIPTAAIDYPI